MGVRNYLIEGVSGTGKTLIVRLHRTREDTPRGGIAIDATAPLGQVVDEIVRRTTELDRCRT